MHVLHEVLQIDRKVKCIHIKNLVTQEITSQSYDTLILAPGAEAIMPDLPGIHAKNICTVKTVPDSDAIKTFLTNQHAQHALVMGRGFIGLETAEALVGCGLTVSVAEKAPQILPPFDHDMGSLVAHHLQEKGLKLIVGDGIKGFHWQDDMACEAELESGKRLPMDLAILSIGYGLN